jgi:hypothetical protein
MMKPADTAEVGALFAGTTSIMARATWQNGCRVIHTADPFGAERFPIKQRRVVP